MPQDRTQQQRPDRMSQLAALAAVTQSMNGGNQEELAARDQALKMDAVMKILNLTQEQQNNASTDEYRRLALQQQSTHDAAMLQQQREIETRRLDEAKSLGEQRIYQEMVSDGIARGDDPQKYAPFIAALGKPGQAYIQKLEQDALAKAKAALYPNLELAYSKPVPEAQALLKTLLASQTTDVAQRAVNEFDWTGHNQRMQGPPVVEPVIPQAPTFFSSGGTITADPTQPVLPNPALQNAGQPIDPVQALRAWQALQQKTSGLNF